MSDEKKMFSDLKVREDVSTLLPRGAIGIELGVAEGWFAERLLARVELSFLYGVDIYDGGRNHDTEQYCRALARLMPYRDRHALLRMTFKQALPLFPDEFFDFVYVDGYAKTGNDGIKTYSRWLPKVKRGGIMAGDDYEKRYPLVRENVNRFVAENKFEMYTIPGNPAGDWASRSTNWLIRKP